MSYPRIIAARSLFNGLFNKKRVEEDVKARI